MVGICIGVVAVVVFVEECVYYVSVGYVYVECIADKDSDSDGVGSVDGMNPS